MNEYILRAKKFRAKKRLGQNFLVDGAIIDIITKDLTEDDVILEIGAGLGFVTEKLVKIAKKVVAVELDFDAISVLKKNLSNYENFVLVEGDILKTDISELFLNDEKIKVIANIPYYITTPILLHLLGEIDDVSNKNRNKIDEITMMVQKEVAKRITASPGSKNKEYGALSILSNFWAQTQIVKEVSKKCFYPSPKVDSAIVKFKINDAPKTPITPYLRQTVKSAFSMRRKNIKNCLLKSGFSNVDFALEKAGIDKNLRGENLSIDKFYLLSSYLKKENV